MLHTTNPSRNHRPPGPGYKGQTYASLTGRGAGTGAGDELPSVHQEHLVVGLTAQVNTNPIEQLLLLPEELYVRSIH